LKNSFKKSFEPSKESKGKYRHWFEDDLTGDFIATKEGKVLECNPSFVDIYGFDTLKKAIGWEIPKFNPEDWVELIRLLNREGKVHGHQSWHTRPDAKKIHVVSNMVGIFNTSDELVQVKGYVFDDTERKKAEESLKKSEEKYRLLFDEDLTGDFIATKKGEILECNPSFAGIYGFDNCNEALRWNISESNPFDWPFLVTRLKKERKIQGYQSWQRRSDGLRIHVTANVVGIFNASGELVQVKGYVFDDTERKKTEQELVYNYRQITEILDSIKDVFFALNPYWNFIYLNESAAEYLGKDPEDLIGQNLWSIFPEFEDTVYEKAFRRAMDKKELQHFEALDIYNEDHLIDFSVYPSSEGISIYWQDITKRK